MTKSKGWFDYSKGVRLALKINKKLLSHTNNIFVDLFIIVKQGKLDIVFFQIRTEIFIQNYVDFSMIIPEGWVSFAWFSEKVLVLDVEVDECASTENQSFSSLNCDGKFFPLIYGKGIRFSLPWKLLLVTGPFHKRCDR